LSIWIYSWRSSISEPDPGVHRASHTRPALPLIQAFILVAFIEAHIYTVFVWLPKYLHNYLGAQSFDAQLTNILTLIIFCVSVVGAGYLARFKNPTHLLLTGILLLTSCTYPLFAMLQHTDLAMLLAVQAAFAVMGGLVVGVIFLVLPDMFKNNWKSFGMASTYSIATAVFGGTAPIVCAYLIKLTDLVTAPALYIVALGIVAAPVAYSVSLRHRTETTRCVEAGEAGQPPRRSQSL
jgi:MFS transporter, MHS family, proline/betaine transporter